MILKFMIWHMGIESGNVFINAYGYQSEIPFGGYKSGVGREHGSKLCWNILNQKR